MMLVAGARAQKTRLSACVVANFVSFFCWCDYPRMEQVFNYIKVEGAEKMHPTPMMNWHFQLNSTVSCLISECPSPRILADLLSLWYWVLFNGLSKATSNVCLSLLFITIHGSGWETWSPCATLMLNGDKCFKFVKFALILSLTN